MIAQRQQILIEITLADERAPFVFLAHRHARLDLAV